MLEQLMQLVREHAQEPVVNNPAVPNENNDAVIGAATQSITASLQDELANGNGTEVLSMLGGHTGNGVVGQDNPLVNKISGNFMDTLLEKFNMDKGSAQQLASSLIPTVLSSLVQKTNDPNNSNFSLSGILNSLTGGKAAGLNLDGILGQFKGGLDTNGDGQVDLKDLMGVLSGGAKEQQAQQSPGNDNSGGLGGMLKNLLG
jgi:hypothetical protein